MVVRLKAEIAYIGDKFSGFGKQANQASVQGKIEEALGKITGRPINIYGAGRTDKGVHAFGQVIHFDLEKPLDFERLKKSLNSMISPDIVVRSMDAAAPEFHARFSAKWRKYVYLFYLADALNPLFHNRAYYLNASNFDVKLARECSKVFIGEHDFSAFCKKAEGKSMVRKVLYSELKENQMLSCLEKGAACNNLRFLAYEIAANSFCQSMVRAICAVLIAVGEKRLTPADAFYLLKSGDKTHLPSLAPPEALYLVEVGY